MSDPTLSHAHRHLWVGGLCALLNIALVHAGTAWLHWPYLAAAWLTCFVTIPTSYILHRRISFRLPGPASGREFGRFVVQQSLQFCAGLVLLWAGVESGGLSPTIAMAVATAMLWFLSFVLHRFWVFRTSLESRAR